MHEKVPRIHGCGYSEKYTQGAEERVLDNKGKASIDDYHAPDPNITQIGEFHMPKKIVLSFLFAVALLTSGSAIFSSFSKPTVSAERPWPPPCFPGEPCPGGNQ